MKLLKLSSLLFLLLLSGCGGIKNDVQGTWSSENFFYKITEDEVIVWEKEYPKEEYQHIYYDVVSDKSDNSLTVDVKDSKDSAPYDREKWYIDPDGALVRYVSDQNKMIEAYPDDDKEDIFPD